LPQRVQLLRPERLIDGLMPMGVPRPVLKLGSRHLKQVVAHRRGREARPWPILRPLYQSGPQRIGLNVEHHVIHIALILDRKALIASLVDMAAAHASILRVKQLHVAVANPVHSAAQLFCRRHLGHKVPVISHQAVAPQLDFKLGDGVG
jgi:hypothetical protein